MADSSAMRRSLIVILCATGLSACGWQPARPVPADSSLAQQIWDLKAPARVEVYPIPPTPGCSTTMSEAMVHELYSLAIQGKIMPLSSFVQDGITFKIEVAEPGQSMFESAYTFNARTDILHCPQSAQQELAIRVPPRVGRLLAQADEAGCGRHS